VPAFGLTEQTALEPEIVQGDRLAEGDRRSSTAELAAPASR